MPKLNGTLWEGVGVTTDKIQPHILNILQTVTKRNREYLKDYYQPNNCFVQSFGNIDSTVKGCAVLLQDGRVFILASNGTTAYLFNPKTNTVSTAGGSYPGSGAFQSGVLLKDGRIFLVPENSTTARIYDPITNTTTTPNGTYPGGDAYRTSVLLLDGRVFMIPLKTTQAAIYDPVINNKTNPIGWTGGSGYYGGVLLPDGRVFCVPGGATSAKIYDPILDQTITPTGWTAGGGYTGGCLLADGRVFCTPSSAGKSAVIYDPINNQTTTISALTSSQNNGYRGCCLLPNGNVLVVPVLDAIPKIYDPYNNTVTSPPINLGSGYYFESALVLMDGRVLLQPIVATSVTIIDGMWSSPSNPYQFPPQVLLSGFLNKF